MGFHPGATVLLTWAVMFFWGCVLEAKKIEIEPLILIQAKYELEHEPGED